MNKHQNQTAHTTRTVLASPDQAQFLHGVIGRVVRFGSSVLGTGSWSLFPKNFVLDPVYIVKLEPC